MNPTALGAARAASTGLVSLGELLRSAVVEVRSEQGSSGTGVVWGGSELVVTNAHCAPKGVALEADVGGRWR